MLKQNKFTMLDVVHHLTSGLKSQITNPVMTTLDTARKACGGAGY